MTLVETLRIEATSCAEAVKTTATAGLPLQVSEGFKILGEKLTAAADHIEAQDKRFAEHLEAWKANNAWHAARIAELERENRILRDYCRDPEEAKAAIHAATGL